MSEFRVNDGDENNCEHKYKVWCSTCEAYGWECTDRSHRRCQKCDHCGDEVA